MICWGTSAFARRKPSTRSGRWRILFPPDVLMEIVGEFMVEMERRFGEHVHVIDWALHLDEATPHIHERHVFDYVNRYGEIEPKQEKALEALGFELPTLRKN